MHVSVFRECGSVPVNVAGLAGLWARCAFALSSHPSSPERHGLCPYPFKRPGLPQVLSGAGVS